MPKKTVEKTDDQDNKKSIVQKAKDCLEAFQDRESDNILRAEEAIRFRAGEQWPEAIRRDREEEHQDGGPRPCPVLDKTNQYIRQIINEERQNRAAIKIRPVDDDADTKTAEIYTGIIRHIEDASEASVAYTTGGEHAIDGGFGYWRILAEYTDPMSFEQDIRIKRIHNRFSVALGPHSESDASDVKEALIWEDMLRKDFKAEFPSAEEVSFEADGEWADKDTVRVAEYFRIEQKPETILLFEDGKTLTKSRYEKAKPDAIALGIEVPEPIKERETLLNVVKWYKLNGEEVLDEKDLVGTYIPIVKVVGNEITMPDGKIRTWGAIEEAMDPQRLHNYAHAGFIESVALAPRAPIIAEEGQIEDYENEYAEANRKPIAVLPYKAVSSESGHPLPPPQRMPLPGISPGWDRMLQNTEHGVEASFGMYGPSVGAQSQEKSGIALREQKAQGMVGNFHFPDNLARSIQQTGRILLEWIPHYYDTERVARILGEDGEQELVYLNPEQEQSVMPRQDEMGKEDGFTYNLSVGKYDVTVSVGPSYTAKRQEAAEMQLQVIQAAPELMPIMGDILFKNMDAPGTDEIAERLKTTLPPEIKKLEADKEKGVDPKVQAAMVQVEQAAQMIEQKGQRLAEIEAQMQQKATELGSDKAEVDAEKTELEAQKKIFMSEAKAQKAQLELLGRRLIDEIEDSTDPIMEKLSEQTERPEGEEEEEMEEINPMAELMQEITSMNAQAQAQMAETVSNALITVSEIVSAPRQTTIINDANGEPTGSISKPILNS